MYVEMACEGTETNMVTDKYIDNWLRPSSNGWWQDKETAIIRGAVLCVGS